MAVTLRRWLGTGLTLLLVTVLGCSSSASAQPPAPPAISPSWAPVVTPDGYSDSDLTVTCIGGYLVLLTTSESSGHWWSLNATYLGTRC